MAYDPTWTLKDDGTREHVTLAGDWALFLRSEDRQRLAREFKSLNSPADKTWDLSAVTTLDSAGAWLLWQAWTQQMPAELECSDRDRHWFEQLQSLSEPTRSRRHFSIPGLLEKLGAGLFAIAYDVFGLFALLFGAIGDIGRCVRRPRITPWREISAGIYQTGVTSLLLLGVTGYVIGVVMSLQIGVTLSSFGANERIIGLMGLAVMRELGPVITALIQVGRAGSSITAGIAGMHLTEEMDALRTFGARPRLRLVTPKIIAMLIAMPLLVVWTDFAEILGGATTAQLDLGVPYALFLARLPHDVSLFNFWLGLAKGAGFGVIIAVVASYFGLKASASTESLSEQTTASVVVGLSTILIVDAMSGAILAKLGMI